MKKLTWQLVLPLSIISFAFITKWWYVEVVDGPMEILHGFPLPYRCPGWHTSMSFQFFTIPLLIDVLVYLVFWFLLIYLINKFVHQLKIHNVVSTSLIFIAPLLFAGMLFVASISDNRFMVRRDFKIKHLDSGFEFISRGKKQQHYYLVRPTEKQSE